jgi:hypothetical protein
LDVTGDPNSGINIGGNLSDIPVQPDATPEEEWIQEESDYLPEWEPTPKPDSGIQPPAESIEPDNPGQPGHLRSL